MNPCVQWMLGVLGVVFSTLIYGQTLPLITYGPQSPITEGDDDKVQVIFLQIPQETAGPLYLRLFDPDTGGDHDSWAGRWNSSIRFTLYGGAGASSGREVHPDPEALTAGKRLAQAIYAEDPALDDTWQTFAQLSPADGEATPDGYLFKLVVEGLEGNDGNIFKVALSQSDKHNRPPPGLHMVSFAPTFRFVGRKDIAELRFWIPAEARQLEIHAFDTAGASVHLETLSRSVPLKSSGQGTLATTVVSLHAVETGRPAALTLAPGGKDRPNDVTFYVNDAQGHLLPLELPIHRHRSNRRPVAKVIQTPLADCRSMRFDGSESHDSDGDTLQFEWSFVGGEKIPGESIVHRFKEPGRYAGRLLVKDDSGQISATTLHDFMVTVNQPPVAKADVDQVAAPGQLLRFDGSASQDPDGHLRHYRWDFDDGTQGTGATPTHAYTTPGHYRVLLTVEDNSESPCNFATDSIDVWVNKPPVAEAGDDIACSVGETIVLDGRHSYDTDGQIISHTWIFEDGTQREGARLKFLCRKPGRYPLILKVRDDAGMANSVATDRITLNINTPPVAKAGEDRRLAVDELTLFDGSGSVDNDGKVIRYQWDFGDDHHGQGQKIPYAYAVPGVYTVTLSVQDNSKLASGMGHDTLQVIVNAPPVARAGPDQVVTASEVRFDGTASHDSDGQIREYLWDFGDGSRGTGASPVHVYRQPGIYPVTLTVIDDSNTSVNRATDTLSVVINQRPIADAGPDRIAIPGDSLTFSASAALDPDGKLTEYLWDFGDGTRQSGLTIVHRYAKPGRYRVSLTVSDDSKADDSDEAIVHINAPPVAQAGSDHRAAPGQSIRFDGSASFDPDGHLKTYRWQFSDDQHAAEAVTTERSFSDPGLYTAQLTVVDDSGARNGQSEDQVAIHINHRPQAVLGDDVFRCDGAVTFDGSASADADGDPLIYTWDFGDGTTDSGVSISHVYAEGGIYPITLTVDDGTGLDNAQASTSQVVHINRPPIANAGQDVQTCAGEVVLFDGSASQDPEKGVLRYRWTFGDGTGAMGVNPSKIYKQSGAYDATLFVEDDSGLSCNADSDQLTVWVAEGPTAEAGPDITVCAYTPVRFDGHLSRDADGVVNGYRWDFGDGKRGGGATPEHVYTQPGQYNARLTVTGDAVAYCDNTDVDEVHVNVLEAPTARIQGPAVVPLGQTITFDGSTSTAGEKAEIVAWAWDFGDDTPEQGPSASPTVSHIYSKPGRYLLTLTLDTTAHSSCRTVQTRQRVTVNQAPIADAGPDLVAGVNQQIVFDGSGSKDADGALVAYQWNFGDGAHAEGIQVLHRYTRPGRYPVALTVRDDTEVANNVNTDTAYATVNTAPSPRFDVKGSACPGQAILFNAAQSTDEDGEIAAYRWHLGNGKQAEGVQVSQTYDLPGRYPVILEVDDGRGANNSHQHVAKTLTINQSPQAEAGPDRTVCPGQEIAFDATGSRDPDGQLSFYQWQLGDDHEEVGAQITHTFQQPGRYNVRLKVQDDSQTSCDTDIDHATIRVNTPPVAVAAGPTEPLYTGGAHDEALFNAHGSHDDDGETLLYTWDFGDGHRKTGSQAYHTYLRPGRYIVRLFADDGTQTICSQAIDTLTVDVLQRKAH
jgi:PKD repeat protein